MSNVKLQWATPDIDKQIMYQARVSNPSNQNSENTRLLYYCMENGHVSPFEMANVCLEINTTRDIARQILRHRSFSFQEYSQRYADVSALGEMVTRECRLQDKANRQNSTVADNAELSKWWADVQEDVQVFVKGIYNVALERGIAKEQARVILPEGMTPSRLYMNGNMRSWLFYLHQRLDVSTQKEGRDVAMQAADILRTVAPVTMEAFLGPKGYTWKASK